MNETSLLRAIRHALTRTGRVTLFRNNSGVDITRGVTYGLGIGSADLVGFIHGSGRIICLEVKTDKGRVRESQAIWLAHVSANGGVACVVRSVDEAMTALATGEAAS